MLGPLYGLIPMIGLGTVALVSLWLGDGRTSGLIGLFAGATAAPGLLVAMFVLRCLSGALLGGLAGHLITEALYKTGVLAGLAIDHARRAAHA